MEQPIQMLNRIELIGRIGRVTIQETGNTRCARFSVVTECAYKTSRGEMTIETTWHNCTLLERWSGQLDGLEKGLPVHIIGRIRVQRYEGGGCINEVVVQELQLTAPEVRLELQEI